MVEKTTIASAPAKVILLGGKAVNWGFPALVAAVGIRSCCTVVPLAGRNGYRFTFDEHSETGSLDDVQAFRMRIDGLRETKDYDQISDIAKKDFFGPTRYVLAHIAERTGEVGLEITWRSEIPSGSGLGSGAAASASMVVAAMHALGHPPSAQETAWLAWQGDVIAHGGVGTGLDSGASALGGIVRYSLKEGPNRLELKTYPSLVIGDTLVRASTAASNTSSRNWIADHPMRFHLLREMGMLVEQAQSAIGEGDLATVGHMMNLSQLIKEKLGMSTAKIEGLIEAALGAGALGAKISGKGGGGIVVALCEPGKENEVARAIDAAGGKGIVAEVGVPGARLESTERS